MKFLVPVFRMHCPLTSYVHFLFNKCRCETLGPGWLPRIRAGWEGCWVRRAGLHRMLRSAADTRGMLCALWCFLLTGRWHHGSYWFPRFICLSVV